MKLIISLALLIAATALALAGGILADQVTIAGLALGILVLVGAMLFAAAKAFNLGRAIERRRAGDEIVARRVQHQLGGMNADASPSRTLAPREALLIAPAPSQGRIDPPNMAPKHVRRPQRVRRAAHEMARRWFS